MTARFIEVQLIAAEIGAVGVLGLVGVGGDFVQVKQRVERVPLCAQNFVDLIHKI